jgi:hypothetical protein
MPRSTRKGLYRVIYLVGGRRATVPATLQFDAAMREFAALKRRGFTAWIESDSGEFVPVEGAMRKPSEIAEAPRRRLSRPNLRMTPEAALQLAGELSQQVSGSKPRSIPGGYRFSDKNEAAQFTTYSPEYSQKVVVVVSIFADGSATVGFFGDEGTSETTRYENVGHFTYSSRTDLPEMVKDIQWVWETVDGYAASWQEDEGGEVDETGRTKTASMYQEAKVFINGRFQVGFTFTPQHGPYDAARTVLQHARSGDVIEVKQDNEVWTYDVTRQPGKPATIVERIESRVDPRTWAEDADGQSTTAPREPALKRVGARDVGDGRTYSGSDIARMHDDLRNHWAADVKGLHFEIREVPEPGPYARKGARGVGGRRYIHWELLVDGRRIWSGEATDIDPLNIAGGILEAQVVNALARAGFRHERDT